MKTVTFTHTFTFPEAAVIGFALYLGYKEKLQQNVEGENRVIEIDNPESAIESITRLSKENSLLFTSQWARHIADEELAKQLAVIKPQIDALILKPVEDALQVTAQINE
jgi:hypothetical protein